MNELARTALGRLLDAYERRPHADAASVVLPFTPSRFPDYFETRDAEALEGLTLSLRAAEERGLVTVEWQPRHADVQIQRIRLRDPHAVATELGRTLASDQALALERLIDSHAATAPAWAVERLRRCIAAWRVGKKPFGLAVSDRRTLEQLLTVVSKLETEGCGGLDMRTLSAKWLDDSKALEALAGKLTGLYREYWRCELTQGEILSELGIAKYPLPFLFRGQVRLQLVGGGELTGRTDCYIGVPGDRVRTVTVPEAPPYVLTVENLASFNRYAREVLDPGVVLFTNGFPGSVWSGVYRSLVRALPPETALHHWGDVDLGGVRILEKIQGLAGERLVRPHLMSPGEATRATEPADLDVAQRERLLNAVSRASHKAWLADAIDAGLLGLEQELTAPAPPGRLATARADPN